MTTTRELTGMESIFIRARSVDADNKLEFKNLALGSHGIGDLDFVGGGSTGANYIQVSGIDFSSSWDLTGDAVFSWTGSTIPRGSNLGGTFKLTNLAPVPLPAAAWLLLAVSGGLIAAKRRVASKAA